MPGLLRAFDPAGYDLTATCSYPFTNWALRRPALGPRPAHVFVTQNGDWPAQAKRAEYRFFGCDGLVCINPDYFERNRRSYPSALIPNGVDTARFSPGSDNRERFGLPRETPLVLMVSALIESKNVDVGIRAVAGLPKAMLVVAGDGPLRDRMQRLAEEHLPGRYKRISVPADAMPDLYRSADVVLHLSRDESFGNVYTEAMATGVPIVAYDSPRTRWILGEEAFLAEGVDGASVEDALKRALRDGGSRKAALLDRAKSFAWSRVADQYGDFFESVTAERRRKTAR